MNEQQQRVARECLDGSHDGTVSFPAAVQALVRSGFEGYLVDYRQNSRTHYLPSGEALVLKNPDEPGRVAPHFHQEEIAAAIRWAQSNAPDYTYVEFNKRVAALGCAGYMVSFLGRRVVYFGRTAETHVEHFPAQLGTEP